MTSPAASDARSATASFSRLIPWIFVVLIVACAAAIRIRLLQTPLERDEGEYAYAGQLILQGIPPYKLAFNMKFPGVYAVYAVMMAIFGETTAGIHIGFLLMNAGTTVLMYLLGKRLFGARCGIAASGAWALLSLSAGVLGTQAHATHFVLAATLGGCLLLARAIDRASFRILFASGLLFGVGVTMKQHGILFAVFGGCLLLQRHVTSYRRGGGFRASLLAKEWMCFFLGVLTPLVLMGLVLWRSGVFASFWFWTVTYARSYVSEVSLRGGLFLFRTTFPAVVGANLLVWTIAASGLALIWLEKGTRESAVFATLFLVFSAAAVCPGLYFREHYFVLMLPAVALLAGAAIQVLCTRLPAQSIWGAAPWVLLGGALLMSVYMQRTFLFRLSPIEVSRRMYGPNPFPEAVRVADYIQQHSDANARIGVLGSEPEIPFYARRHAASGYLYVYPLLEPQPFAMKMQTDFIGEFEASRPQYVVVVNVRTSWLQQPDSSTLIFDWWRVWGSEHYRIVGIAEILSERQTEYHWAESGSLDSWRPRSPYFLAIYKRITT